jgi:hypothetical protein
MEISYRSRELIRLKRMEIRQLRRSHELRAASAQPGWRSWKRMAILFQSLRDWCAPLIGLGLQVLADYGRNPFSQQKVDRIGRWT